MTCCLKCCKIFRHYTINFKPDPMYTKMYEFIPIVMCAFCRHELAERQKILLLEHDLFEEFN